MLTRRARAYSSSGSVV